MIEPVPVAGAPAPRPLAEVPGVLAVHDPRPPLARALTAAAGTLRIDTAPPVDGAHVVAGPDGPAASAAISVHATARVPEVARAVADELLAQHPDADRITVEVRRIA